MARVTKYSYVPIISTRLINDSIHIQPGTMDFYWDRPVLIVDSVRKKNQPVRIIGPVHIIGT